MSTTPKQLSNPFSTGGGGAIFESRVQAAFVALMLSKGVCPCLPSWQIYKVKLQGKYSGYATDDVIIFARHESLDREAKLIAQIKHSPAITKADTSFAEVIQSAWSDFQNPSVFEYGYDALALITGPLTATDTYEVRDMLEMARTAQDSTDFFDKVKLANFSGTRKQEKLEVFQHHLTNTNQGVLPDLESIWKFIRSFHLIGYDLDIRAGVSVSLLQSLIGVASSDDVEKTWLKILNEVQSWNPRAGVLTLKSLPNELLDYFRVITPPQLPSVVSTPIRETIAATLIGSWDENLQGDRDIIERFTGMAFATWQDKIRDVWLNNPGIFDQKDGKWKVSDRKAFWDQEGPRVNDSQLDQFKEVAVTVLKEIDPALDLDPDDRFAASIYGKVRQYSGRLRKSVAETLALLGVNSDSLTTCSRGKPESIAHFVVREVLMGADEGLWASLNDVLSLLAEASPESFKAGLDEAIVPELGAFAKVFEQESSGVMGRTYITGVLWGLEALAWNSDYLVSVCRILSDLAAIDPGGNWSNRPAKSLSSILLPWLPQTCANTEKRHAAVRVVAKRHPEIGWKLVCSLLPKVHSHSSGTHKPIWRKYIPDDRKDGVSQSQYWEDVIAYGHLAIELARSDVDKIAGLVRGYFELPIEIRGALRERMLSDSVVTQNEDSRFRLWQTLNQLTTNHRKFADHENWRVPEEALEELDVIADQLSPTAPEIRHRRLFGGDDFDLYEETGNWEEQEQKLHLHRQDAVSEIVEKGGTALLLQFAGESGEPWRVGYVYGSLTDLADDAVVLPTLLESSDKPLLQFAGGYVWGRHRAGGWKWVDSVPIDTWTNLAKGLFFTFLPFCEETWTRVSVGMPSDEKAYWQNTSANPYESSSGLDAALDNLIVNSRPEVAIRCMQSILHKSKVIPVSCAVRALQSLTTQHRRDAYAIGELLSFLQNSEQADVSDVRTLEWKFILYLGRFNNGQPVFLSRWLAEDPDFFCVVIQTLYRSTKDTGENAEPSEELKAKATHAYHLLDEWVIPPGTQRDHTFSDDALASWVVDAKVKCIESGHWEVAESQIGQVLRYAPREASGLWIDSVCAILDEDDHSRMRSGITMEIRNGRGTYTPDGGKWEAAAAEEWGTKADIAETNGFSRLAQELRGLSDSYRRDAERESKSNRFDID